MGEMRILGPSGDESLEWDPKDKEQVKAARARFKELTVEQGYHAYRAEERRGARVEKFDPKIGKLLLAPAEKRADKAGRARSGSMAGGPTSFAARIA